MEPKKQLLVGVGLYTISEAARLARVRRQSIRRWLFGYTYRRGEAIHHMPPVWHAQFQHADHDAGLSFLDLIEVRFVDAFRRHGVPWAEIRRAAEKACDLFKQDHPFSNNRFRTDGRRIFAEILEGSHEKKLLALVQSQYAFHNVLSPTLYTGLEFSDVDEAMRWFPMHPKRNVVVDPNRAFGRPIVAREGVPTEILAKAIAVEGSAAAVAKWFDVTAHSVRAPGRS